MSLELPPMAQGTAEQQLAALRDDTRESLLAQWIGNAVVVLNVK